MLAHMLVRLGKNLEYRSREYEADLKSAEKVFTTLRKMVRAMRKAF